MVDEKYRTVAPVEEWLEAHRLLWSPNTVRGYATSLAQWWTFLEQRGETAAWGDVGVPAVAGFLSWLRNGRTVEHALVIPEDAPAPETLEARLAALISFYRWQEVVWACFALTDIRDQGLGPRKDDVHHGEHGEEEGASSTLVHGGVQG